MLLPLVLAVFLLAAGVATAAVPVETGTRSCGSAWTVWRDAALPGGLQPAEQDDCREKARASVEVAAATVVLALIGMGGVAVAGRARA